MGKSFEIRPTGMAHAELLLPEEEYPDYPKTTGQFVTGKVVEHYSWKKVTTNVSGFILGQPTIDHYGEMTVCHHNPLLRRRRIVADIGCCPDHQSPHERQMHSYLQASRLEGQRRIRDIRPGARRHWRRAARNSGAMEQSAGGAIRRRGSR